MSREDATTDEETSRVELMHEKRQRRVSDVAGKFGSPENILRRGYSAPILSARSNIESPDQGYPTTPTDTEDVFEEQFEKSFEWHDVTDASPQPVSGDEDVPRVYEDDDDIHSVPSGLSASMPLIPDANRYNMNHKNRGKCLVFNHDVFELGFEKRTGSCIDTKRIQTTFGSLGFTVQILDNLKHSDIIDKINDLSSEDHTDNDCLCVFVLTHGLNNGFICANDVAYKADSIWKPFTADRCISLAGKPKLFFFQACRGNRSDRGITLQSRSGSMETDSAVSSYKIPTHSDFLIAHSTVEGFYSWRNPKEGSWYVQCLCDVLDNYAMSTDLARMLTLTARKVATEHATYNDLNPAKADLKQVPSTTSMLIRELYFTPKLK
ncbi:caspase-1 isoform X2 [Orussus abietinus]|nr:caspase-1 isoform X2 [Orussus abietinus]XP_012276812.1 caspase-1 isoform X2 [Orussus abietinus]